MKVIEDYISNQAKLDGNGLAYLKGQYKYSPDEMTPATPQAPYSTRLVFAVEYVKEDLTDGIDKAESMSDASHEFSVPVKDILTALVS